MRCSLHQEMLLNDIQSSKAERELCGKKKDIMFEFISEHHEVVVEQFWK